MTTALAIEPLPQVLDELPVPAGLCGPYMEEDFALLAGSPGEERCELLRGHLVRRPVPSLVQRAICREIATRLRTWATRCSVRMLGPAPFVLCLGRQAIVRPALAVALRIGAAGRGAPPDLVVEVLEGGDARRERELKPRLYAEAGVREYWIVDPAARTVDFLVLQEGRYAVFPADDGVHRARALPGLRFDVADLWWDVDQLVPFGLGSR